MNETALKGTEGITKAAFRLIINDNVGNRLRPVPLDKGVEVPIMSDGHLVQKAWLENVGFVQSQIVEMIVGRPINWSCFRQAAAAILIHKRFPKDICCKAEPVFRGEIVIDATVIDVICVRLWVKERDASDLKARTRARWFIWAG